MAIRNIIQKAEQEFPPGIKQESDPVAGPELALLSGYVDTVNTNLATTGSTLNTKIDNLSGYINSTDSNIVYTTGTQTISGEKTFSASLFVFSGANVVFVDNTGIVSGGWKFGNRPTVNGTGVLLSGEAAQLPETIVYTTGNQTISSLKNFTSRPTVNGTGVLLSGEATQVDLSSTVSTTGNQTISGNKTFEADEYIFSGTDIFITGNSTLSVDQQTQTKGIVKNIGGASGMQVMTTGAYNTITPLSGVVYILI